MSASTEKIALKVLATLKAEWEREPSLLKWRLVSDVLGPLKDWRRLTDAEIQRGLHLLVSQGAIDAVNRDDGMAAIPNKVGLEILSQERQKSAWTLDRRLTLYKICVAIIAVILTILGALYWLE